MDRLTRARNKKTKVIHEYRYCILPQLSEDANLYLTKQEFLDNFEIIYKEEAK